MAPRLLERVRPLLRGRVVSGDALSCQKALCQQLRTTGGEYLFAVKDNQPTLHADIALLFMDPPPGEVFLTAQSAAKHGGRLEQRQVRASATLSTYLQEAGWPDVGLVLEVASRVRWPAHPTRPARHEVRYFVSSLPITTSPAVLLQLVRRHWHIENRVHWLRDVTLGEDGSQVRSGRAPQALAALRNAVIGLLHTYQVVNCAAALRTHGWSPPELLLTRFGLASP